MVRDDNTLPAGENEARAVVEGEKAARTPRFVTTTNGRRSLDEAALARARQLQDATGLNIRQIVHIPRPIQRTSVRMAGHEHLADDPITPPAAAILHALDINPD